jgi:hypothetical protein
MEVHEMSEFSFDKGSKKEGIKGLIGSVVIFVVIPLVGLILLNYVQGMILSGMSSDDDKDGIISLFNAMRAVLILYLIFGIPAIVFRTLGKFYPAGNRARLTFKLAYGVYFVIWLLIITAGGLIQVDMSSLASSMAGSDSDYAISNLKITLDITGLMIILVLVALLKNIVPIAEYKGARKEYLEDLNDPKDGPEKV